MGSRGIGKVRRNRDRCRSSRGVGGSDGDSSRLVGVVLAITCDRRNLIGLTIRLSVDLVLLLRHALIVTMSLVSTLTQPLVVILPVLTRLGSHVDLAMVRLGLVCMVVKRASLLVLIHWGWELISCSFGHVRPGLVENGVDLVLEDWNVGGHWIVHRFGRHWTQDLEFARVLGCLRWDHVGRNRRDAQCANILCLSYSEVRARR